MSTYAVRVMLSFIAFLALFPATAFAQPATITVVVTGESRSVIVDPTPDPVPVQVQMAAEPSPSSPIAPVVVQGWDTGAEATTALMLLGAGLIVALRPRRALRRLLAG